ncbi:hypothetical protein AAHA92_22095 [Salvia divinorum]|uniref:Uncharacterized protein n=1 Tax=Salvia divinorum TaxID=28513 RepID=A0ABD1GMU7_SALDI
MIAVGQRAASTQRVTIPKSETLETEKSKFRVHSETHDSLSLDSFLTSDPSQFYFYFNISSSHLHSFSLIVACLACHEHGSSRVVLGLSQGRGFHRRMV